MEIKDNAQARQRSASYQLEWARLHSNYVMRHEALPRKADTRYGQDFERVGVQLCGSGAPLLPSDLAHYDSFRPVILPL